MSSLALDIGGTKISVCRVSDDFCVSVLKTYPSHIPEAGTLKFLDVVKKIIRCHLQEKDKRICLGFKGLIDNGQIIASSLLGVFGEKKIPFSQIIYDEFNLPCIVENDVICMALAEDKFGKARDWRNFVLVNIGTGIRAVMVQKGTIFRGFHSQAGEVGRLFSVIIKDRRIEEVISGRGLSQVYSALSGEVRAAKDIFARIGSDKKANEAVSIFQKVFAQFLKAVSLFYGPEFIVLAGSLTESAPLFLPQALCLYEKEIPSFFQFRAVEISNLKHSVCLGAVLAFDLVN